MRPQIAIIGITIAILTFVTLHILNPDIDPIQSTLSTYVGSSPAFIAQGIAWATLARVIVQLNRPIFGLILLYLAALASIVIGTVSTELPMQPIAIRATIHKWSRLTIFLAGGLAPLLLTLKLRSIASFEPVTGSLLILAVIVLIAGIIGFFTTEGVGLVQRIHILLLDAWIGWVSWRLFER